METHLEEIFRLKTELASVKSELAEINAENAWLKELDIKRCIKIMEKRAELARMREALEKIAKALPPNALSMVARKALEGK